MPNIVTLRELIKTFTEQELDMAVPIDFKNPTSETIEYANEYNEYLAQGKYQDAYNYRVKYSDVLEPMIHDANALNRQQAMMINTYLLAARGVTQNITLEEYRKLEENGQVEKDITYFIVDGTEYGNSTSEENIDGVYKYVIKEVTTLPSDAASKSNTIYIVG